MPLDAQKQLVSAAKKHEAAFVYWLQDVLGVAAERILKRKLPLLGGFIGRHYRKLEARLLHASDAVVSSSGQFAPVLAEADVPTDRHLVQPNWSPLDHITPQPKTNAWSQAQGLSEAFCFLYSGTLSMKHNPRLLLELAREMKGRPDVRVVVISQGQGMDWLRQQTVVSPLPNLVLLPYQSAEALPDVLATADVLVAVLQPEAAG